MDVIFLFLKVFIYLKSTEFDLIQLIFFNESTVKAFYYFERAPVVICVFARRCRSISSHHTEEWAKARVYTRVERLRLEKVIVPISE